MPLPDWQFNQNNSSTALTRGFRLYLPLGEVGIAFSLPIVIGTGWDKYKISVPDGNWDETGGIHLWLASGIVGFKKFFIPHYPKTGTS